MRHACAVFFENTIFSIEFFPLFLITYYVESISGGVGIVTKQLISPVVI
jgi:hypothetical protein